MSCLCPQDNGSVGFEHKDVGLQGVGSEHYYTTLSFSFCSPSLLLPTASIFLSSPLCSPPSSSSPHFSSYSSLFSPFTRTIQAYFWSACCRQTTMLSKVKKTHQCQLRRPLNTDRIRLELGQ